jgi:hypothetical protein
MRRASPEMELQQHYVQGDQIGRIFAVGAFIYFGEFF